MPTEPANRLPHPTAEKPRAHRVDAVTLEVFRHLFTALADEMGAALRRASYSPNIKERRDYSCALFDRRARPVALGDHMPVHLGAMPMSVAAALDTLGELAPGDVALLNDPFLGGTHLPDLTAVAPVHDGAELLGFVAARAHHSDVGGITPGSMPLAREIVQEGLRIPPVRLVRRGIPDPDVRRMILANVRTPDERAGDLDAQLAALHTGAGRLLDMVRTRGRDAVLGAMDALIDYADRLLAAGIGRIPDGAWQAEDHLEDDGFGSGPIPIRVKITIAGDHATVDFTGSSPQVPGGVNAVAAITSSATRYVLRSVVEALLGTPLPAGGGSLAPVTLVLPPGSVVAAEAPASVAAGNVETSQRITDVLFRALAAALPDLVPALSQGTMNNLTIGGTDPRTGHPFAYYETMGGGMGAGPTGPGLSGVHTHMSNSLNTPVEALEHAYPFRVTRYALREGSGGEGLHRGGEGLERELVVLADARITVLSERRETGPAGALGGGPGAPGENELVHAGESRRLPGKVSFDATAGDRIAIRSPGGGGWGRALGVAALLLGLAVAGGCTPPDARPDRGSTAGGNEVMEGGDSLADAPSAAMRGDAAARLERLERYLLEADTLALAFQATATGAFDAALAGRLALEGRDVALDTRGHFGERRLRAEFTERDGRRTVSVDDETGRSSAEASTWEAVALGFTRMGILHNLSRLVRGDGPDHSEGGVANWVQSMNLRLGEPEVDGGTTLLFDIVVDGRPAGSATLVLGRGGLPVERRQRVDFAGGSMEVVERYDWVRVPSSGGSARVFSF